MHTFIKKSIFILSCIVPMYMMAQTKVAVYVTGEDAGINKVLSQKLIYALGKCEDVFAESEFKVIERQESFLSAIVKEQAYQRSGAVDDDEIARMGKQFGAQLVCVAVVTTAFGRPYITVRLIDAETAEIEGSSVYSGALGSVKELRAAGDVVGKNLLESTKNKKTLAWKKVAIYVNQSEETNDLEHILGDIIASGFARTGRFVAIERTQQFLAQLQAEHDYQRSGAVDDKEISRLGKQSGVDYVCVIDITEVLGEKYISAHMINVETAEVINTYEADGKFDNVSECFSVAREIGQKLSKGTYMEQLRDETNTEGIIHFTEWKERLPQVNIPEWFMDLSEGTYVGISLPGGEEMDAILLALVQKIIAEDNLAMGYNACFQKNKFDGGRKGYIIENIDSTRFSITTEVRYDIQEITLLPTGEYICRITDGKRNRLKIGIEVYNSLVGEERMHNKQVRQRTLVEKRMTITYGKRSINNVILCNTLNDTTISKFMVWRDRDKYSYMYRNEVTYPEEIEDTKLLYKFPTANLRNDPTLVQHHYRFETQKSFQEQLLQFYVDIIRSTLPRNKIAESAWDAILRKGTPIKNIQYENGEMIINCKEE